MAKEKRDVTITANSKIESEYSEVENIIFTASGTIEDDGKKITIKYVEPGDRHTRETKNIITFDKDRRGEVTLSRRGGINSLMLFEVGGRYNFTYDLGFASMELCTSTFELENRINYGGGKLGMFYVMESRGMEMQRVRFTLTVK